MPAFVWIALAVFVVLFAVGGIWLTVNVLRAWRRGRPVVLRLMAAAAELRPKVVVVEGQVVALEPRIADLQRSTTSLAASVARAKLLLGVVHEAKTTFDVARAILRFR